MSGDTLTRIRLPGPLHIGLMDWGERTTGDMLAQIRDYARHEMEKATAILAAADDAFQIDVVRGVRMERLVKTLQAAKAPE